MTTLTYTGPGLGVVALGIAWVITQLTPHGMHHTPQAPLRHRIRRLLARVPTASQDGPSPLPGGEGPLTAADPDGTVYELPDIPVGYWPRYYTRPADTLADAGWGDLHAALRDGEPVDPLPPTRIPADIAAHFARREAGEL